MYAARDFRPATRADLAKWSFVWRDFQRVEDEEGRVGIVITKEVAEEGREL